MRHARPVRQRVRGGFSRPGDQRASIVGLKADLERAADDLPERGNETQRVFVVQGRGGERRERVGVVQWLIATRI